LKSKRSSSRVEEVTLVGGPFCGMTYALHPEEGIRTIEIPGRGVGGGQIPGQGYKETPWSHRYERDDGVLFYYTGDII